MIRYIAIRVVPVLLVLLVLIVLLTAPASTEKTVVVPPENQLSANLAADRPLQALYQINVIAAQTGWTADLARSAGTIWLTLGNPAQAAPFWELAAQKEPYNLALAWQVARIDLDLQRWSAAIVALNHVLQLSDDDWAHYELGLLQAAFNPQQALNQLRMASRDPVYRDISSDFLFLAQAKQDDPATVMRVGLTLASHKIWNYAELVFQYAADLAQPFPEALAYAGLARDNQGKDGSAQIQQAVTLAPLNAQVHYLLGLHLRLNGDNNGSLLALRQTVDLDPLNPAFAAELGSAYQLVDQLTQAEYWLKQAVTLSHNDPRFQDLLNHFYQQFPTGG